MPTGEPKTGGDKDKLQPENFKSQRTKGNETADIRDVIGNLIGGGHKDLSDEYIRADYVYLANQIGEEKARKIFNYGILFNQKKEVQGKSPQERIKDFYDINPRDKELGDLFGQLKSFSYGPGAGLYDSPDVNQMKLSDRYKAGKGGGVDKPKEAQIQDIVNRATTGTK